MYCIQKITVVDKQALFDLLGECFNLPEKSVNQQLSWRYEASSFLQKMIAFGAYTKEKQLVSFYANVPHQIVYKGKSKDVYLCLDIATKVGHRRQGLISQLSSCVYQQLDKNNLENISIGFSNKEGIRIDKNSRNYGYQIVGSFQTYIRPSRASKSQVNFKRQDLLEAGDVWPHTSFQIHKNSQYLKWRYLGKSHRNYNYYSVIHRNATVAQVVAIKKKNKVEIIDVIPLAEFDIEILLRSLPSLGNQLKRSFVTITVLKNRQWQELLGRCHYLPQPLSRQKYYLTIRLNPNYRSEKTDILSAENWLLFSGDIL